MNLTYNTSTTYNWVIPDPTAGVNLTFMIRARDNTGNQIDETFSFTVEASGGGGGAGGGGGGGGSSHGGVGADCVANWSCGDWSSCSVDGTQTRECVDTNNCVAENNVEVRSCIYRECVDDVDCNEGYE